MTGPHRGNPLRPWSQNGPSKRVGNKTPLPDLENLAEPETMTTWELTQRLGIGEMKVASVHDVDGWVAGGKSGYDPTATYTRATNKFDHAVTNSVRVPTEVDMLIGELVQRLSHVKNKTEFIRDAIIHNLFRYADMMEDVDRDWTRKLHLEVIRCHQDRIAIETSQWTEIVKKGEELFEQLAQSGDRIAMGEALDYHAAVAEQSPEPWRGKLEAMVERYRGRLGTR